MAVFSDTGLDRINDYLIQGSAGFSLTLRLYTNNYVPNFGSNLLNFIEVPPGMGYVPFNFIPANWVGGATAGLYQAAYPPITFSFSAYAGPVISVYGYYVTDMTSGDQIVAELAAAPYAIPNSGGSIIMTPTWIMTNL